LDAGVIRIALIGDYDPTVPAHVAIPKALDLAARRAGVAVAPEWVGTATVEPAAARLAGHAGVWCVPASPYASMDGALAAIRFARESGRPFLGTCGGFQHGVLEYARNVLGHAGADHAETAPDAAMPVIARLTCSLVEKAEETYRCNYGLNPAYEQLLAGPGGLRVAARDANGEVRAVELPGHPFFMATLFQPERAALRGAAHPLVTAFVAAAARHGRLGHCPESRYAAQADIRDRR
jgi:CTP synthase (UTP-ammonia lyase)